MTGCSYPLPRGPSGLEDRTGGCGCGAMEREGSGRGWGPARVRSPALPGGSLCLEMRRPEPAICREAQKLSGPRATEPRLFMADPPSGGALGRRGPGGRGGRKGGRDRGGGGGGQSRLPTPPRPRSHRRASTSLPPGTLPGETRALPASRKSRMLLNLSPRTLMWAHQTIYPRFQLVKTNPTSLSL